MTLLLLTGWAVLVLLTVGPIFSAQKNEKDSGWPWILAALIVGPLAGIGYYTSRYAMRKVTERHNEASLR